MCPTHRILLTSSLLLATDVAARHVHIPSSRQTDTCQVMQLTASLDNPPGELDGMPQRGALLLMRNRGHSSCTLVAQPVQDVEDAAHHLLLAERRLLKGGLLGQALPPMSVSPGQNVITLLHWGASHVVEEGTCLQPAVIRLTVGDTRRVSFDGMMCASPGRTEYLNPTHWG